jgi:hypothetical protein
MKTIEIPILTKKEITRFEKYFIKLSDDECWMWMGRKIKTGRGYFQARCKRMIASRVSYSIYIGIIPAGVCVLHKCDHPGCVNPSHLWLGTQLENIEDRDNKHRNRLSHPTCIHGHYFTEANTGHYTDNKPYRTCKTCRREYMRAWRELKNTRFEAEEY